MGLRIIDRKGAMSQKAYELMRIKMINEEAQNFTDLTGINGEKLKDDLLDKIHEIRTKLDSVDSLRALTDRLEKEIKKGDKHSHATLKEIEKSLLLKLL